MEKWINSKNVVILTDEEAEEWRKYKENKDIEKEITKTNTEQKKEINTFSDLMSKLDNKETFEKICINKNSVYCKDNKVYLNNELRFFLKELGAEISYIGIDYVVIITENNLEYIFTCKRISNTLDKSDDIIINFNSFKCFEINK